MFNFKINRKKRISGDIKNVGWFFYWFVLFIVFTVLILGIILLKLNTYFNLERDEVFVEEKSRDSEEKLVSINKEELLEINHLFDKKTGKFEELKEKGSVNLVDPSL